MAIAYYELYPEKRPHIFTSWTSKEDFIETILASCNFPFYFSRWPLVKCRDAWAVDGMFTDLENFGCPLLPSSRTIAIVAAPNVETNFDPANIIQPGLQGMDLPYDMGGSEWFGWTIAPAPDEMISRMIALGKQHAKAWVAEQEKVFAKGGVKEPQLVPAFLARRPSKTDLNKRARLPPPQQPQPQLQPPWVPRPQRPLQPAAATVSGTRPRFPALAQMALEVLYIPSAALIGFFVGSGLAFAVLRFRRRGI